jgi:hypothetical protein
MKGASSTTPASTPHTTATPAAPRMCGTTKDKKKKTAVAA